MHPVSIIIHMPLPVLGNIILGDNVKAMKKILLSARHLAESVLPLLFWVFLIFGFDSPDIAVLTIAAAIIHELGHISALLLLGRSATLRSHLSGFRIKAAMSGYREELIVLAAGPLANIAVFIILLPFFGSGNGYIGTVALVNLLSAVSNLLPVEGYDGYGMLYSVASSKNSTFALRILFILSFAFSLLFTLLSLYLILRYGSGYWIFAVFFAALLGKIKKLFPKTNCTHSTVFLENKREKARF